MKKTILFAVSFLAAGAVWAQQAGTQAVNADSVPIEEYVPKVIIEGKWGTGPGEFGVAGVSLLDLSPISPNMDPVYPGSLAVNSTGEIYILDIVNNRIQKFSGAGMFMREIAVDSWSGYVLNPDIEGLWESKITGINIAIDSKDTLYYYLKRTKEGKETGEVWEFRKDKLVKKTSQKLQSESGIPLAKYVDTKIDADVKEENKNRRYGAIDSKKRELKFRLNADEELYGKRKVFFDESTREWYVRVKKKEKVWYKKYDSGGKLLSISEVPVLSEFADSNGNYYVLEADEHGLKIRKSELVRTLK